MKYGKIIKQFMEWSDKKRKLGYDDSFMHDFNDFALWLERKGLLKKQSRQNRATVM